MEFSSSNFLVLWIQGLSTGILLLMAKMVCNFLTLVIFLIVAIANKDNYYCNADENKKSNATYIISVARKLGCSIFLLPEDIMEVRLQ